MLFIITIFEREPGSRTGISLKFFEALGGPRANAYVIENVLLFIPFGIFIPLKWKQLRNPFVCSFLGFCLSCIIEIIQLITERGHFQIDDIVTNTLGTLIGALIFRMYSSIMLKCRQFYAWICAFVVAGWAAASGWVLIGYFPLLCLRGNKISEVQARGWPSGI